MSHSESSHPGEHTAHSAQHIKECHLMLVMWTNGHFWMVIHKWKRTDGLTLCFSTHVHFKAGHNQRCVAGIEACGSGKVYRLNLRSKTFHLTAETWTLAGGQVSQPCGRRHRCYSGQEHTFSMDTHSKPSMLPPAQRKPLPRPPPLTVKWFTEVSGLVLFLCLLPVPAWKFIRFPARRFGGGLAVRSSGAGAPGASLGKRGCCERMMREGGRRRVVT